MSLKKVYTDTDTITGIGAIDGIGESIKDKSIVNGQASDFTLNAYQFKQWLETKGSSVNNEDNIVLELDGQLNTSNINRVKIYTINGASPTEEISTTN